MSNRLRDRICVVRAIVALHVVGFVGVLLAMAGWRVPLEFVALFGLAVVYFVALAFDAVREHPLFHVGQAAWFVALLSIPVLGGHDPGLVPLSLFALAVGALLVECYNYWQGTSYLRLAH